MGLKTRIQYLTLVILPQVIIDPTEPVPVPSNPNFVGCGPISQVFGFCAPAGATTASQLILGLIQIGLGVAGMLAVLFVIVGGIRYITAHGNEEQAEAAKKTLQHAIIGVVLVILSFVIIRIISNALILGRVGA